MKKQLRRWVTVVCLLACAAACAASGSLEQSFLSPPASARPWVYWFWLNGNISREGITADLEAMKQVGVGGVLIMEVDQGAPLGPVGFMSPQWRTLFRHVTTEAHRLGLQVNMNDDAGWNGSGGPWIKPAQSMQKVVWTETEVVGPQHFDSVLMRPKAVAGYYQDIAVLAFPASGEYRIPGIEAKAAYRVGAVGTAAETGVPSDAVIARSGVTDISVRMGKGGHLVWDVPAGKWTIARFGHTSTGAQNSPAPASGRGLECDKLSDAGVEAQFKGMMAKLISDVGSGAGRTLVATHVDSWENGSQNWTDSMRAEFRKRRGYDMLPFLPAMMGRVIGSAEISQRFLWDLRKTISELVVEKYAGHMQELAHAHGMKFTIEAYGGPCDDIPYAGQADEPMGEFWMPSGAMETLKGMSSAAHVYGKPIVGAESFTAGSQERWRDWPGSIKSLGDRAFCDGINRFVFHRYAMQPWTREVRPGMTMGPWGLHYERTNTWWQDTAAWHRYLARCQFLLRQGRFVADICYLQPEAPPHSFDAHGRRGYDWDECSADVVLKRMSVRNGRIVLPDGMSYQFLALSDSRTMTPRLLSKIGDLIKAGATVVGPPPQKSPSLTGYPRCDREVKRLSAEIWGNCDGKQVWKHLYGKGRVIWGVKPERLLDQSRVARDFSSPQHLEYIHRFVQGTHIYFVANPQSYALTATCTFRVNGKVPELWWPETGRIETATMFEGKNRLTSVVVPLGPSGSVFVVFHQSAKKSDPFVAVTQDGKRVLSMSQGPGAKIVVRKADYGVLDDPGRTRDVRDKVQSLVDSGEISFQVSRMAAGDDPAYGIVKTLVIEYTVDGKPATATGTDPDTVDLVSPAAALPPCRLAGYGKSPELTAWEPGDYAVIRKSGRQSEVIVPPLPETLVVEGPWTVRFAPGWGAPKSIVLGSLVSWSEHPNPGIKYFSGTATYETGFDMPKSFAGKGRLVRLDLGDVEVMAAVKLNGKNLGILWKPPYMVDITRALKPGTNDLEIEVTNLWPNRMIGDEQLPDDSDRNANGTLKSWPEWLLEGKPSPTGRYTFTSWRLWGKNDALLKSGLVGPVTLQAAYKAAVR